MRLFEQDSGKSILTKKVLTKKYHMQCDHMTFKYWKKLLMLRDRDITLEDSCNRMTLSSFSKRKSTRDFPKLRDLCFKFYLSHARIPVIINACQGWIFDDTVYWFYVRDILKPGKNRFLEYFILFLFLKAPASGVRVEQETNGPSSQSDAHVQLKIWSMTRENRKKGKKETW